MTTEAGQPLERARAGDRAAFDELLLPQLGSAYRLAVGILLNQTEAEDAVQEAAFKAWRKIRNVRPDSEFRPWFMAIVANECRRLRRLRWWSVVRVAEIDLNDGAAANYEAVDLARAFARLSVAERQILVLRYYGNLSVQEVADVLKLSTDAAKSRIHRALRKLRPFVALDSLPEVS